MPSYRVTRTVSKHNWVEIDAKNKEEAIESAEENDVWYGDDDGSDSNYDQDEFEAEEI